MHMKPGFLPFPRAAYRPGALWLGRKVLDGLQQITVSEADLSWASFDHLEFLIRYAPLTNATYLSINLAEDGVTWIGGTSNLFWLQALGSDSASRDGASAGGAAIAVPATGDVSSSANFGGLAMRLTLWNINSTDNKIASISDLQYTTATTTVIAGGNGGARVSSTRPLRAILLQPSSGLFQVGQVDVMGYPSARYVPAPTR